MSNRPGKFRDLGANRPLFRPHRYEDISNDGDRNVDFDSRGTSSLDIGIDNGPGGTGALYVVQPAGQPSPYDVVVPGTDHFEGAPWTGERHFALAITAGTLSHLISVVNANASPGQQFSTNLADYQLSNVSVDAELEYFGQQNSIGFSMSNFQVAEATQPIGTTQGPTIAASPAIQPSAPFLGGAAGGDTLLAGSGNTTLVGSHTTCSSAAQALPRSSRAAATTRFSAASAVAPSR